MSNAGPFAKAFLSAALILSAGIAALFIGLGAPGSPSAAIEAIGRLASGIVLAAVIAGLIARRSRADWSFTRVFILVLVLAVVAHGIAAIGRSVPAAGV